jgi:hypothetical protein
MTHRNDPDYDWPSLLKGETSQSCLVVKYGELSLRLCIMPRKILLHIWYIRLKYDRVRHNCSRSSRDAVSNEPLHDHGWCSVDDALVMVPVKNLSPLLRECSSLPPWQSDPSRHHLSSMMTMCVYQESENDLQWVWNKLKSWGGGYL